MNVNDEDRQDVSIPKWLDIPGSVTDDEVAAFRTLWRERSHDLAQVIECGPVERLEAEMRELRGAVDDLRAGVSVAEATARGTLWLGITMWTILAVAVVILAVAK